MTAAAAEGHYLLHIVSEQKPDLSSQGHANIEVGEERTYTGPPLFPVFVHNSSLSHP